MIRPSSRFVFFDRDGVINVDRDDYTTTIEEWTWAPGAREAIRDLTRAGLGVIVITNQGCIAKGTQTEAGLERLHRHMLEGIRAAGGDILRVYHCPHRAADGCACRKPEPGMLLRAAADFGIRLPETFFVGDAARDVEAGRRAGARTILIRPPGVAAPADAPAPAPEFVAANVTEAAAIILRESGPAAGPEA